MSRQSLIIDISERIADHFPLGTGDFTVEIVIGQAAGHYYRGTEPAAMAVLRTLSWEHDLDSGARSIRDIKEQEVHMGWPAFYDDDERVAAFFGALGVVIDAIASKGLDVVDGLMPADLICTDVLGLKRARTQADFEAALRAKSRLGQHL